MRLVTGAGQHVGFGLGTRHGGVQHARSESIEERLQARDTGRQGTEDEHALACDLDVDGGEGVVGCVEGLDDIVEADGGSGDDAAESASIFTAGRVGH